MKNPLLAFCRRRLLRRDRSTVPTGLLPLRELHSAAVFVDPAGEDAGTVCSSVRQFFEYQGIPVTVLCPAKGDLNLLGAIRKRLREDRSEDLFISLAASPENFAAEYEARCSTARFKVGCCPLPGGVFDLVVAAPEGAGTGQAAAFAAIKDYLDKIR